MSDVLTKFGRRLDAIKELYDASTGTADVNIAPNRPLGNITLVGNVLIDLHHRCALAGSSLQDEVNAIAELAEWEWSLIEAPLHEKMAAARRAQS